MAVASLLPANVAPVYFTTLFDLEAAVVTGEIIAGASSTAPEDFSGKIVSFSSNLISARGFLFSPKLERKYVDLINQATINALLQGASAKLMTSYAAFNLDIINIQVEPPCEFCALYFFSVRNPS